MQRIRYETRLVLKWTLTNDERLRKIERSPVTIITIQLDQLISISLLQPSRCDVEKEREFKKLIIKIDGSLILRCVLPVAAAKSSKSRLKIAVSCCNRLFITSRWHCIRRCPASMKVSHISVSVMVLAPAVAWCDDVTECVPLSFPWWFIRRRLWTL